MRSVFSVAGIGFEYINLFIDDSVSDDEFDLSCEGNHMKTW